MSDQQVALINQETQAVDTPRRVPYNEAAEQALLGALLVDNRAYEKVSDFLTPDHFYDPAHGRIYKAIVHLIERGQIADPITLKAYFEKDKDLAELYRDGDGGAYLHDLVDNVVTTVNAGDYGRQVYDLHLRRQLITIGEETSLSAYNHSLDEPATEQIESAEQKLFDLATTGGYEGGFISFKDSLAEAIEQAQEAFQRDSHITGITSGLRDIDRKLGGLHPSDLIILAGRPSMGKTALATNIAFNAAKAHMQGKEAGGGVVGFFSLEMSAEQLATRLLAAEAEVSGDKIRRGDIRESDFPRFAKASEYMSRCPLFIDDTPALSVSALRTRARRLKRTHGLGMLVIDYLQLMRGSSSSSESRVQEISEITRGLKAIAKELDVPVIALSQLSRAVESRDDKRPMLSDLRESGSIEQDADVVMFVFREQYYLERAEPMRRTEEDDGKFNDRYAQWQMRCSDVHNTSEVIIAKQRHGPIGSVKLFFDGQYTKFSDLETDHIEG